MSDWQQCLEALDAHLVAQQDAVAGGRPEDVRPFVPPTGLGPVPAALAERAHALAARNEALVQALAEACAGTSRQLQLVSLVHSRPPAGAAFVDARS